jgi:hypothetical protein
VDYNYSSIALARDAGDTRIDIPISSIDSNPYLTQGVCHETILALVSGITVFGMSGNAFGRCNAKPG